MAHGVLPPAVGRSPAEGDASAHDEIQWRLLKLGSDLGLDVWVARNDRGRAFDGQCFAEIPRLKTELRLQFHQATTRTIEWALMVR